MRAAGRDSFGLEALCSATVGGGTAPARSLVDDINAALSAVSGGGGGLPQQTHGAGEAMSSFPGWAVQSYRFPQGQSYACG